MWCSVKVELSKCLEIIEKRLLYEFCTDPAFRCSLVPKQIIWYRVNGLPNLVQNIKHPRYAS